MSDIGTVPTTVELLEGAIDVIEKHGWGQGTYICNDGSVCALGAIRAAAYGYDLYRAYQLDVGNSSGLLPYELELCVRYAERSEKVNAVIIQADDLLQETLSAAGQGDDVPNFNDSHVRTMEDVTLLLKHALEAAKEEEAWTH